MSVDISNFDEDKKYDFLKHIVNKAQNHFGNNLKPAYGFQDTDDYVNLISIRGFKNGKPCKSSNQAFDDSLYVVFKKDGKKNVKFFQISTEFGNKGTGLLILGQHEYCLNFHKKSSPHQNISSVNSFPSGKKYRALNPYGKGVKILRDTDRDFQKDENESYEMSVTHNIHFGGEGDNPQSWSEGCQVIKGWANYKEFIKLVESDHSIYGTENNELASVNKGTGTRAVIYTLVDGDLVEQWGIGTTNGFLPVNLGDTSVLEKAAIQQYYTHSEKETEGGYYPVGSNTLWHGGLHIFKDEGTDVVACMSGKVVCGRLTDDATKAVGPFGHRNFLLLEHEVKSKKCYSLYMHLKDNPLSDSDEFVKKVKWLQGSGKKSFKITGDTRNYRSSPDSSSDANKLGSLKKGDIVEFVEDASPAPWKKVKLADGKQVFLSCDSKYVEECTSGNTVDTAMLESLKKGDVVKIDREIQAGDLLWKIGKYGPKDAQKGLVHWEIFSEENLVEDDSYEQNAIEDKKPVGLGSGYTAEKGIKVRGVAGPSRAKENQVITCIVTTIDFSDAPGAELEKINWNVQIDGVDAECSSKGYRLEYTIPENSSGKTIKIRPFMNKPSDSYCVTIFVEQGWTSIEDPDDDFNAENDKIISCFGDLMSDGTLTQEELKTFYANNPDGKAEKLRNYVCKFASEWGVTDLAGAIAELKKKGFDAKEDDYKPYLWWPEATSAGVTLPSAHVWHYNPIRFLEIFGQSSQSSATPAPQTEPAQAAAPVSVGVKKCEGPETVDALEKATYKVTKFNGTPSAEQKKNINWIVYINGEERKKVEKCGEVFELDVPDTWAGDEIVVHPYINKPSPDIKVSTKVGPYFLFDGKELAAYSVKCTKGVSWPACSGEDGVTDQSKEHGPIPEGKYLIEKSNIQNIPGFLDRMASTEWDGGADYWGEKRLQVFSFGAKTFGRMRFYIHGGKKKGSGYGIDLTDKIEDFISLISAYKRDKVVLVVRNTTTAASSQSAAPAADTGDEFKIDWSFIAEREGTRNDIYVPVDKNGNVLGVSGPTIASGFDLGQIDIKGLEAYKFEETLESKLKVYVSLKGETAKKYVKEHPLTISNNEVLAINKKVKNAYAIKAEKFYNEAVTNDSSKFKTLPKEAQTAFASVYFQYGVAKTLRGNLIVNDYKAGVNTLLNFTTKTEEVTNRKTGKKTNIMQYLSRRCKEARYLLGAISNPTIKTEAEKLIDAKEKELKDAKG